MRHPDLLHRASRALARAGHEVSLVPTTGPRTAGGIARRSVADGATLILAAGGDGTINEVVDGMAGSSVALGILPAGTANVLAAETGMAFALDQVAKNLACYVPRRISLGRLVCNGQSRYFLLMAGIGLDADIVYHLSAELKTRLGKLAYWIGGFRQFGRELQEFDLRVDGHPFRCSFALVSKVRNYGGDFQIARSTSLLDDSFEVVLFEGRSTVRYVQYLVGMASNRLSGIRGVSFLRAREVSAPSSPDEKIHVQVDGEYAGHLPARIEVVPDALTLLIPPKYLAGPHG